MAPRDSTIALALVSSAEGGVRSRSEVCCALSTRDITKTHARLRELGVDIDPEVGRVGTKRPGLNSPDVSIPDPQPPQVCFRDPDGNRFLLVEAPDTRVP